MSYVTYNQLNYAMIQTMHKSEMGWHKWSKYWNTLEMHTVHLKVHASRANLENLGKNAQNTCNVRLSVWDAIDQTY